MAISMKTAYKFRAYPSKEQKEILNKQMYLSKPQLQEADVYESGTIFGVS
jgi:hypothetical protein